MTNSTPKPSSSTDADEAVRSPFDEAQLLVVRGDSMRLLLKAGDLIAMRRTRLVDLRVGDMAVMLDWKETPNFVVHRLCARFQFFGRRYALTKGDGNFFPDPFSPESGIVGRVTAYRIAGAWYAVSASRGTRGILLSAASAPIYRLVAALTGIVELALRYCWKALPRRGARPLATALSVNDRISFAVLERLQSICAGWARDAEVSDPGTTPVEREVLGILDGDQEWSGTIRLTGDVYVPFGVTLRIAAGARIQCAEKSTWDYVRECGVWEGWGVDLKQDRCRLIVAGRLLAEGAAQNPIRFGGSPWGGIHFVTESWGSLISHAELSASENAAVGVSDGSKATIRFSRLTRNAVGVAIEGGASALIEDSVVSECRRHGFSADGGFLELSRTSVENSGDSGVFVDNGADLSLLDCSIGGGNVGCGVRRGSARMERVRIYDTRTAGLHLDGRNQFLRDVAVSASPSGVIFGGDHLAVENLTVADCADGVRIRSGQVGWAAGSVDGGRCGLRVSGAATVEVRDVKLNGQSGVACAVADSAASLVHCEFSRAKIGLETKGARIRLDDCRLVGNIAAIHGEDSDLQLSAVEFSANEAGVDVARGTFEWDRGVMERHSRAALICSGRATLRGIKFSDCGGNAVESRGGPFAMRDCEIKRVQGIAVSATGTATLQDVGISGCGRHGVEIGGGTLAVSDSRMTDIAGVGIRLLAGELKMERSHFLRARFGVGCVQGNSFLDDVRFVESSQVGVSLEGGRHRLRGLSFADCEDNVYVGHLAQASVETRAAWWRRRLEGARARVQETTLAAVLRTRRWAPAERLYRSLYDVPVRFLRLAAACDANVSGLFAYRSYATGQWDPGTSDVDLLLVARALSEEKGRLWMGRFWRLYRVLKFVFPFLGEVLVVEPGDVEFFARWGGLRARNFSRQLVRLSGRVAELPEKADSGKRLLEPLGEAAHAYTRLMVAAVWNPTDIRASAGRIDKAARDVMRIGSAGESFDFLSLAPRSEAFAILAKRGDVAAGAIATLRHAAENGRDDVRARAEICAESLSFLHRAAVAALGRVPPWRGGSLRRVDLTPDVSSAAKVDLLRRRRRRDDLRRDVGEALVAACGDDLYRTVLIVDDAFCEAGELPTFFSALSRRLEKPGAASTVPLVLSRSLWRVWSFLPYLESPLRFHDAGAGEDSLISAGPQFPGIRQYSWGFPTAEDFPAAERLILDMGRECLATLSMTWRYQMSDSADLSQTYKLHYLCGRIMGLRLLLERGIVASFFDIEKLRALFAVEFPDDSVGLERWGGTDSASHKAKVASDAHRWADSQLRRAAAQRGGQ